MIQVFDSILEFTKVRTKCVFCESSLVAELSNFSGTSFKKIPSLTSKLDNNKFNFHLSYNSFDLAVDSDICLDANTGIFTCTDYDPDDIENELDVFIRCNPYISLNCENKKCKTNYYAASDILKFDGQFLDKPCVKPLVFNWEAFNYKKLWVQNDWINMKTLIYSTNNPDAPPITNTLIDFRDIEYNKLITRIKTLVTFS